MRDVSNLMWAIWKAGDYIGDAKRPMTRVTIQVPNVKTQVTHVSTWRHTFNQAHNPKELPNLKSCSIDRSIDQDSASCTLVFYNTRPLPIGQVPTSNDLDEPGYYTYNHGVASFSNRWGHVKNQWQNYFVPDRCIRTYQGYGFTVADAPEEDAKLVQTGEWWIDKVTYSADDRLITVTCRDRAGPALIDQINFPPVVPSHDYPLEYTSRHKVPNLRTTKWKRVAMSWQDDSNTPWVGHGQPIYGGHNGVDAFDKSSESYWLSIGNSGPNETWAYEWIQGACKSTDMQAVTFLPWKGHYVVYVSVYANGSWQGSSTIPYDPQMVGAPNGSDIKYVKKTTCGTSETRIDLGTTYHKVTKVRLTFHNLADSNLGTFQYRAGVRNFEVEKLVTSAQTFHNEGNYSDYCEIVKWLLCWGGFFWPQGSVVRFSNGDTETITWTKRDKIVDGRVWADIEMSGVSGPATLDVSIWDKKPLMDNINYIKNILGYIFFVDEEGAAVFRLPNIYKPGNFTQTRSKNPRGYTTFTPVIDEKVTLIGLKATLDKQAARYRNIVANADGRIGAAVDGRESFPVGWKRVGIWSEGQNNFLTKAECAMMAELITVAQLLTFRTDSVTIQGFPAFQIDDQVRIFERITGEGYYHYIRSINSDFQMETGEYTMELTTNWLGEQPFAGWWFDPKTLSKDTKGFLDDLQRLPRV